jgi:hypothetical protein
VSDVDREIRSAGGVDSDVVHALETRLKPLQDLVSGYDFALVVTKYLQGFQSHQEPLMASALRWLRGEYHTKTEARKDLDVRAIIDDTQVYDYLKLFASFVRLVGFSGLLVNIDEMGVLSHRLNNAQSRNSNYESVLRIVNDCLQGNVSGIGFLFGGTDTFLEDRRRGMASYEALATRLAANTFAQPGLKDLSGPVIHLTNLSAEDLYILLHNIRDVFALGNPAKHLIDEEGIEAFMAHCAKTLGAEFFLTPREATKAFTGFLSVIEQNPGTDWRSILSHSAVDAAHDPESEPPAGETDTPPAGADDLASFQL